MSGAQKRKVGYLFFFVHPRHGTPRCNMNPENLPLCPLYPAECNGKKVLGKSRDNGSRCLPGRVPALQAYAVSDLARGVEVRGHKGKRVGRSHCSSRRYDVRWCRDRWREEEGADGCVAKMSSVTILLGT